MTFPETERVTLREFVSPDFEDLHDIVSKPVVCLYMDWGPNEASDTRAFLAQALRESRENPRQRYSLAVVRKQDLALIGSCELWQENQQHARGGVGFVFDPAVWGQGFATETAGLLLRLGFERLGLHRIEATCRPDNIASRKALENAGFRVEGRLRNHVLIKRARQDSLLLGALSPVVPPNRGD